MYLYYVVGTEPANGRKPEKQDTHAIIAPNDEALREICTEMFIKFENYHAKHKLNKDWK